MQHIQEIIMTLILAAVCGLAAYLIRENKQRILQLTTELINRAEEAVQGSGMGAEKKQMVIAQLEAAGVRVTAWLSREIDFIVETLNARGAWLAKKTQENISGMAGDPGHVSQR